MTSLSPLESRSHFLISSVFSGRYFFLNFLPSPDCLSTVGHSTCCVRQSKYRKALGNNSCFHHTAPRLGPSRLCPAFPPPPLQRPGPCIALTCLFGAFPTLTCQSCLLPRPPEPREGHPNLPAVSSLEKPWPGCHFPPCNGAWTQTERTLLLFNLTLV